MANMIQNKTIRSTDYSRLSLLQGIQRLPTDNNRTLKDKIVNLWRFRENTTIQGLVNSISNSLGYDQYNVITRRIFILTHQPAPDTNIIVTVNGSAQTQITEAQYPAASTGYVVWKDSYDHYTRILEFVNPPAYARKTLSRKHDGSYVKIDYQWHEVDHRTNLKIVHNQCDECNPYDAEDTSFMGYYPEAEGSIGVYVLNNKTWLDDSDNGLKNADGTPTQKLWSIMTLVDRMVPTTWGE